MMLELQEIREIDRNTVARKLLIKFSQSKPDQI